MSFTIPSDAHSVGDSGHVTDHNNIADVLTGLSLRSVKLLYADQLGADPTGAADSTAVLAAAQTAAGSSPYLIVLSVGTYKLGTSSNLATFGRYQGMIGPGASLCTINYAGTGTCIAAYDSSFSNSASYGGRFGGFTIDGTSAGSAAIGLSWGNLLRGRGHDLRIQNFTGATAIGLYYHNGVSAWSEEATWASIVVSNCTTNVYFDTGSFDYSDYDFYIFANSGQDGVRMENNASIEGNTFFRLKGNFATGAGNTGAVIAMDRLNTGTGSSRIDGALLNIGVESDGSTGLGHITVFMNGGSSSQFNGVGVLRFLNGTVPFQAGTFTGSYGFSGSISEPTLGKSIGRDSAAFNGGTQWGVRGTLTTAYGGSIFTDYNDIQCFQLASGATSLTFSNVPTVRARRMELFIVQPASGGAGTITWPTGSGGVVWQSGSAPVLQTANGAVDRFRFTYLPSPNVWYGEYVGLDQNSAADVTADGTQALGSTGKPGDAGHVHPSLVPFSIADRGYLVTNEYPELLSGNFTPTSGTIYFCGIQVRQNMTPGHVSTAILGTAASGVTASENFIGLYNSAGTRLAQVATDSSYGGTFAEVKLALSPGALTPGLYWVAWLMNATTMPQLAKISGGISGFLTNIGLTAATSIASNMGTQTSLPASITPSSLTLTSQVPWVALST